MNYKLYDADVLVTQLRDEGVAFNSSTNEYLSLNETSFKILKGIENSLTTEDICEKLENEYNVSPNECREAVNNTIRLLLSKKLIIEQ